VACVSSVRIEPDDSKAMSSNSQVITAPDETPIRAIAPARTTFGAYVQLSKARLNAMVVVTTAVGYLLAAPRPLPWMTLLWTCLGVFLAAIGASAFNQAFEAKRDARMQRTHTRPVPSGRISLAAAITFGLLASIIGVAIICPTSTPLAAVLTILNILFYALVYTPMKPMSSANTLVGAVVGALPPMIGWAAATGTLDAGALLLGGILFVWQIPHFLALAWLYREDYARGGYKMLSNTEPTGRASGLMAITYALALIPLSLALVYRGHAGIIFGATSIVLGAWLVWMAMRFAATKTKAAARALFLCSVIYLPMLLCVLVCDMRQPLSLLTQHRPAEQVPFVDPAQQ